MDPSPGPKTIELGKSWELTIPVPSAFGGRYNSCI